MRRLSEVCKDLRIVLGEASGPKNESAKAVAAWLQKHLGGKFRSDPAAPTRGTRYRGKGDIKKLEPLLKSAGYKKESEHERYGTHYVMGGSKVGYWQDGSIVVTGSASEKQKTKARRSHVQYD